MIARFAISWAEFVAARSVHVSPKRLTGLVCSGTGF